MFTRRFYSAYLLAIQLLWLSVHQTKQINSHIWQQCNVNVVYTFNFMVSNFDHWITERLSWPTASFPLVSRSREPTTAYTSPGLSDRTRSRPNWPPARGTVGTWGRGWYRQNRSTGPTDEDLDGWAGLCVCFWRRGGRDGQALLSNGSAPLQSPNNTGARQVSRPRLGAGCSAVWACIARATQVTFIVLDNLKKSPPKNSDNRWVKQANFGNVKRSACCCCCWCVNTKQPLNSINRRKKRGGKLGLH